MSTGHPDWSDRVGGLCRALDDERELHLVRQAYNVRLSIGPVGGVAWDDSW